MESLHNQQVEPGLHGVTQSDTQRLNTRIGSVRIFAGLAGTCMFALAVLFACSKGGGHSTPAAPVVPTTTTTTPTQLPATTLNNPNAVWQAEDTAAVKLDFSGVQLRFLYPT